jgi:hypothetical protein
MIEYVNEMYNKGYFKALLDIRNEIEFLTNNMTELKSKKKYVKLIQSMMKLLTENSELRDDFRMYGGFLQYGDNNLVINLNTGEMLYKRKDIKDVKS